MCITLPTKVLSVTGNTAQVEVAGLTRKVFLPFESVSAGDWVLLYAGAAICVIDEEQALETLKFLSLGRNVQQAGGNKT